MSDLQKIKRELSQLEHLERELNLKQLQINGLLGITQAINNNVSADGLFKMYASFVNWEMAIEKMALYVKSSDGEGDWVCEVHRGIDNELVKLDISDRFENFQTLKNIEEEKDHPFISEFDVVIPVLHKKTAIAYSFFGGFGEGDDMYSKVKFITTITNIIAVAIENKRLFKRQIEQERLNREMELAGDMQQMLIPSNLPKNENYEFAGIYKPHLGVGGDYYDFVELEDDKFAFCIADISGKGLAAALLMASFQSNYHALIRQHANLEVFIRELNTELLRITNGDRFLTFFVGHYCKESKILHYINAGHNAPILWKNGATQRLEKGCTILGAFDELPLVEIGHLEIDEDTFIVTYTDGLTDVQDKEEAYFDEDLLEAFVNENANLTAKDFNDTLYKHVENFKGDMPFPDDFTLMTCKIFNG